MSMQSVIPQITGVILAGGKGRRMGGQDKGWLELHGRPLVEHLLTALRPQVATVLINANRHQARYRQYGYPVISDTLLDYQGPLAGFAAAMQAVSSAYLVTVPCDAPYFAADGVQRLWNALQTQQAELAVAHDGTRLQPVHALLPVRLLPSLQAFLAQGGRKVDLWYAQHSMALADFSDSPRMFMNSNTPEQHAALAQALPLHPPLLGMSGWSGAGKTTLLSSIIPHLKQAGLRVSVIKHGHHRIDLDTPGKDTYRFREAGADQVIFASQKTLAVMHACATQADPELRDVLRLVAQTCVDLVLVEGFKHSAIPKLEVHRPSVGKPLLYPDDPHIIAIATDAADLVVPAHLSKLDLNQPESVATFILKWQQQAANAEPKVAQ